MRFKNQNGLSQGKKRYKGNLHSHTTNSDGHLTPKEAVKLFKLHGYNFLCFSEHDRYTDMREQFDTEDFIILPGLEASAVLLNNKEDGCPVKVHHMNGILGTKCMQDRAVQHFQDGEYLTPQVAFESWDGVAIGQKVSDVLGGHGCLVTYNHPVWSRVTSREFFDIDGIFALEIYNYNTVNESNTGADTTYWDLLLRSGRQIYAFASDDNHNAGIFDDACGGWIVVNADELTHELIIQSLLQGDYYSSSGPEIYAWGVKDDTVWVECSSCERVNFIAGGFINAGATVIAATRDGLKKAEYYLRGDESYVRVECIDYAGKTAWTNAIFLNLLSESPVAAGTDNR